MSRAQSDRVGSGTRPLLDSAADSIHDLRELMGIRSADQTTWAPAATPGLRSNIFDLDGGTLWRTQVTFTDVEVMFR